MRNNYDCYYKQDQQTQALLYHGVWVITILPSGVLLTHNIPANGGWVWYIVCLGVLYVCGITFHLGECIIIMFFGICILYS